MSVVAHFESRNHLQSEVVTATIEERCLTEVDNLNANRLANGEHSPWVLNEELKNLISFIKEGSMPYAITTTEHPYESVDNNIKSGEDIKAFTWLGKTAVEHAMSGVNFHKHPEALKRVAVEIDEAHDAEANLRPGVTKVFISPRMTRLDATYKVAQNEHLADEDAVRISRVETDAEGNIQKRVMESLLVREIPLQAWVSMLNDPDNIFGKKMDVEDNGSALPVMQAHRELEIPDHMLKDGVISIVEAVSDYIDDQPTRESIELQLARFRGDQADMHDKAVNIAKRWQKFEISLADSLHNKKAVPEIRAFINSMQSEWGENELSIIRDHQVDGAHYRMSRELAIVVEQANQNLLWTRSAVVTQNEKVLQQLSATQAKQIYENEMLIQTSAPTENHTRLLVQAANMNRQIAKKNVKVGGGCAGVSKPKFNNEGLPDDLTDINSELSIEEDNNESRIGKKTKGRCKVEACPTNPREVLLGGCDVCLENCQKLFDKGKDPTKMYSLKKEVGSLTVLQSLISTATKKDSKIATSNTIKRTS